MDSVAQESDVIVTDQDTAEEDSGDSGGLYPYDPTKADIDIREDPQTVFELMRKYDNGKLIIDPDFQRNPRVWKLEQKSKFIESVILNFPLPPWYVNQTEEGKYIVVDGLQRTTTLHDFVNNTFKLSGLEALPKLNGSNFTDLKELPGDYQTRIEDKKLNLYIIKPSVPVKVVYDIFNRINTGGTNLSRQEVRNCIFSGKSTNLLKELSEQEYFRKAIDKGISPERMKDREIILRYLAFRIFDYTKDYQGDLSDFLEKAMKKINLMSDEEIKALKRNFERVMNLSFDFFGDKNFRLPTGQTRGRINIAIFESVSYFFSISNDKFLEKHKEAIKSNFSELLENQDYLDSIKFATSGKAKVSTRFKLAQEILGDV
ncbi:conserved hypothetical protein [Coleofasciculus chthonoplastes PCC 7420]|uniref:GmrSD restriction endonucleases N-terminal domain-containing protein n=1 Tax=Coleofasciculus chthonoplastes PCC 7420 TaxID=118168 RepID=B4VSD6_9CYAN|nr:DUF262 domain-containing protein [Coleofasciculus chthonoplastes]EDX75181.1 conserved hypothetical protein [Coleofasciculus chthonoplastes PCC 7420]